MNEVHGGVIFAAVTMFVMSAWAQDESESEPGANLKGTIDIEFDSLLLYFKGNFDFN